MHQRLRNLVLLLLFSVTLVATVSRAQLTGQRALPDAPSYLLSSSLAASGPLSLADAQSEAQQRREGYFYIRRNYASKYATVIDADEKPQFLSANDKLTLALVEQVSPFNLVSATTSAGWSHIIDSAPHYGTNRDAFAQRFGAAMARQATQSIFTDGVFSPIFHDDPRYYVLGDGHGFMRRLTYAATRVLVTRSDGGSPRFNAPLWAGYLVASGMNNLYYPDRDRSLSTTFRGYGTSLAGASFGFVVSEFLDDALHMVHLKSH